MMIERGGKMTKIKKVLLICAVVLVVAIVVSACYLSSIYTDCRMSNETFENSLAQPVGEYVDADMLYADEEKAIFYYINGIFVYNYNYDKIEQMIDLEKLNCAINQPEPTNGITIHASSDGKKLGLYNYAQGDEEKQFDNYLIYTETGIGKKEAEPDIGNGGGIGWASWIAELDCWRSGMFVYVGKDSFYLELEDDEQITQLKLVAVDENNQRKEFYPFDDK